MAKVPNREALIARTITDYGFNPDGLIGRTITHSLVGGQDKPAYDKEKRTAELSFFSDTPQLELLGRTLVYVKLSMKPAGVNLERFQRGLAFTENHDIERRLGKGSNPRLEGSLLRATGNFTTRPHADEIFNETIELIDRGFFPDTSGLARLDKVAPEPIGRIDGIPVVLAEEWTPTEMCIATIGKDNNTGVGRAMDDAAKCSRDLPTDSEDCNDDDCPMHGAGDAGIERTISPQQPTRSATVMTEPKQLTALEKITERQTTYEGFVVRYGSTDEKKAELKRMAGAFALGGKTETELLAEISRMTDDWAKTSPVVPAAMPTFTGQDADEISKRYSISRAVLIQAGLKQGGEDLGVKDGNCFELEVSRSLDKLRPREYSGPMVGDFRMPLDIPLRGLKRNIVTRAGLDTQTSGKGSELVFAEYQSFIDVLRNRARVAQMGAQIISGMRGNPTWPRQTAAGGGSWVGENPGADVADQDLGLDQIQSTPKTFQASTSYSRQLLVQNVGGNLDNIQLNDLTAVNSLEIDRVALHGSGSAHQPRGIYNMSGVNSVTFISGGVSAPVTYSGAVDMETVINAANADVGTMGYLTTPEVKGTAKKTAQLANTIALPIWQGDELNGYRALSTNQISKTLGAGTDHGMVFGVWEMLMILEWGGALEVIVDPYRLKKQGMIETTTFLMADLLARHTAAFSIAVRLSKS
jgi:HK97 family phage major capsid protein